MPGHSRLAYEPETGQFVRGNVRTSGLLRPDGYRSIGHLYRKHLCHRLAWQMAVGEIPEGYFVDHINRDRSDNRLCNLRLLTPTESQWNRSDRFDGSIKGITRRGDRWEAHISIGSRQKYLGRFDSKEAAEAARRQAELDHWPTMVSQ